MRLSRHASRWTKYARLLMLGGGLLIPIAPTQPSDAQDVSGYAVFEFVAPGNTYTIATGISNNGNIAGTFSGANMGSGSFYIHNHQYTLLSGVNPDIPAAALDLNSSGWVAGFSHDLNNNIVPTLWIDGVPRELPSLGGTFAKCSRINELGHIAGQSTKPDGHYAGAFWADGQITEIGNFGYPRSFAYGINNLDQVVGAAADASDHNDLHPFLWENGVLTELDIPSNNMDGSAYAINDHTQIVGEYTDPNTIESHAFIWEDGASRSIHGLGGPTSSSAATSINNAGVAVGYFAPYEDAPTRAFVWDETNGMRDLQALIAPDNNWNLAEAADINDAGFIVGYGNYNGSVYYNMALFVPVRPTLNLDQPAPGIAGRVNTITVHSATPGARVTLVYGKVGGGYKVPACDYSTGAAFQMDDPKSIGSAIADQNGDATLTVFVPNAARNAGDILIQAVEQSHCKISQLIVQDFQ